MRAFRAALGLMLLVPSAALAGVLQWTVTFPSGGTGEFQRPTEGLDGLAPGPPVRYEALSIYVDTSGIYDLSSRFEFFGEPFDGMLFLYAESFDSGQPLRHLVAGNDDGDEPFTSEMRVLLTAGVIYQVVTARKDQNIHLAFTNRIEGPGEILLSSCFLGDEPDLGDDGTEISLLPGHPLETTGRFCVGVSWRDFTQRVGIARPTGHRSDRSATFWFFSSDNWELSLKVLDGCAINGHYWVLFSGSTNVGFDIAVTDIQRAGASGHFRTYHNPLGHPAGTVLDTTAFECDPPG